MNLWTFGSAILQGGSAIARGDTKAALMTAGSAVFDHLHQQMSTHPAGTNGLLDAFASALGPTGKSIVSSWIGNGPNQPITGEHAQKAAPDLVNKVASVFSSVLNLSPQDADTVKKAANFVASMLPQAVDELTAGGKVPGLEEAGKSIQKARQSMTA